MEERLPKDLKSEQAILGGILQDNCVLNEVRHILEPHDFSMATHIVCFRAMLDIDLNGGVIDKVTLLNRLREQGIDNIQDDYLIDLISMCDHPENAKEYANIIRDKSAKRMAIKYLSKSVRNLIDEGEELTTVLTELSSSTNRIFISATNTKYKRVNEIIMECIDKIKMKSQPDYKDYSIIPSGLDELDKFIKGHRLGCLDVVAARPSMGKTSLALSILLNVSGNLQIPSMMVSLEMTEAQLGDKILSMRTGVPFSRIEEPKFLTEDDRKIIGSKINSLGHLNLSIDDNSYTPTDIVASIRSGARDGMKFFVVDHLHLINFRNDSAPRHQQIGKVTKTLAALAKELDIHIMVLSQLNREIEKRDGHHANLADLKDSSDIEMDATMVMFIHRDDYYDSDSPVGKVILKVAKNRYGERNVQAEVSFMPSTHLFCNKK